jgi:glycosyltransferase involved in cell wall biosynthesis
MRIAQLAPLFEDVPPRGYGGSERVIAALCDALVAAGHDVTLFATETSRTRAHLEPAIGAPLRQRMTGEELIELGPHLHLHMLSNVYRRAGDFDVIHAHTDLLTLPFADAGDTPTVLTMHGRLDVPAAQRVLPLYPEVPLVSISDDQRRAVDHLALDWVATVPNGLELGDYLGQPRPAGDHLAFLGRISGEKRPDLAVEVARRTGRRLRIAAKVDPTDVAYYTRQIEPMFNHPVVEFLGELSEADKPAFFAGAAATLFPSDWPEPFGLVLIESLATGTPVIALRRGAVPEILEDGISGFLCDDVDEMVAAVDRLGEIDPAACRRRAMEFTAERMAARYEDVYVEVVSRASASARPTLSLSSA